MRTTLSSSLALGVAGMLALQFAAVPAAYAAPLQDPVPPTAQQQAAPLTADQIDNLVAPVALYADPLLAQVLIASTFPDQIAAAAQYVRANGTSGIDDQYWDVSVKAVAHYPTILNMMDTRIDWTTSLGQAYAVQSSDVMQSVQHMRQLAQAQGNLQTTPQQQVVADNGYIQIWPEQPSVIYVPVYDPAMVYYQPIYGTTMFRSYFSFGIGYPIGAWLMYDWDWPAQRIVYTGWYGGGWIARSRPYVRMNSVYLNAGYRNVYYNRNAGSRGGYAGLRNTGHGVVTSGSGYRQGNVVAGSRAWSGRGYSMTPRYAQPSRQSNADVRTAQPVRGESNAYVRSAQPRWAAQQRAPQSYVRSVPQARPSAPAVRYSAPQSHGDSGQRTAHQGGGGGGGHHHR